ncbi:WAT1-related protein At1g25270 isoform X2 [Jatropha curcas]|uniref:WAT1-related protein At1g25270 isoform X2 n=1 Tax=Jatropha curcas TaxID=180498 RepID=UPI0005FA9CDE|nr:WAT1-related protein At1g25270 isoform X2 [Jatropha curcas]
MMIMMICKLMDGVKPVLVMVVVQVAYAGVNVLYKLAASDGMSLRIIIAYRFIFATALMVPLALFFERKNRPKLTWTVLFQAFLCGLFGGSLSQNMYLKSLVLTSATFASAMFNLVPAVTFILAISFGLEKMGIRSVGGKAKVVGTVMGISGAMLLTFYKGAEIKIWKTRIDLLKHYQSNGHGVFHLTSSHSNHALGCLLAVGNCFLYALWLIIQAKMSTTYPCPYSSTALMCLMASIQASVYALCMEKDWSQWKLGWNIRLLTAAYAGIVVAGIMITLVIWCVRLKGPLFVSIFSPLTLVGVAVAGSICLNENLHLGSILGASLIVCGLYVVLWGKNAEIKKMSQLIPLKSTSTEAKTTELVISSPTNDNCKNGSNVQNCNCNDLLEKEEK